MPLSSKRSALSRARNLGSGGGSHEWWAQRISGIVLIPLFLWFMAHVPTFITLDAHDLTQWISIPFNRVFMSLFTVVLFYHASFGAQTVLEDYVSSFRWRLISILMMRLILFVMGLICIYSILTVGHEL